MERALSGKTKSHARLWLLLLGLLCGGSYGCGSLERWEIVPTGDVCNPIKMLRDQTRYEKPSAYDDPAVTYGGQTLRTPYSDLFQDRDAERGCFVMRWEGGGNNQQITPVLLDKSGAIKAENPVTMQFDARPPFSLPRGELRGKPLQFFLFILRPVAPFAGQDHAGLCKQVSAPGFVCFDDDLTKAGENPCWFYVKIQPQAPSNSAFTLAQVNGGCAICSREICGNGADDDCDGQVDEFCDQAKDCHHPGKKRDCYSGPDGTEGKGLCRKGIQVCNEETVEGKKTYRWGPCEGERKASEEVCNGLDDDCDGKTDEELKDCCAVGTRESCYTGSGETRNKGSCTDGFRICTYEPSTKKGKWGSCEGEVKPTAETCNGKDDDCDGEIDEAKDLNLGQPCTTQKAGECSEGSKVCLGGVEVCEALRQPTQEICDGKDNDCDGQTDEFFAERGRPCTVTNQQGICAVGVYARCVNGQKVCTSIRVAESGERCDDGEDNNCDGKVDSADDACACKPGETRSCYTGTQQTKGVGECKEGTQTCTVAARWSGCVGQVRPTTEICDGKDNDCDGQTDESFPEKDQVCFIAGKAGPCGYGKYTKCGTSGPECVPDVAQAATNEICGDKIDNNCNGLIDETPPCSCTQAGLTQACYRGPATSKGKGICQAGLQTCSGVGGSWSGCVNEVLPQPEVCDGKDNDCDGQSDEDDPKLNQSCQVSGAKGICRNGRMRCEGAQLKCKALNQSRTESCNGRDDDCDGDVDEDDPLLGKLCSVAGQKGPCASGKLVCKSGALACEGSTQKTQETCNGVDDDCDGTVDELDDMKDIPECPKRSGVCAGVQPVCAGVIGWLACSEEDYFASSPQLYEEKETKCDGKDNDCDGKVDQGEQGAPLQRDCYEGPAPTKGVGTCKGGTQQCTAGQWGKCEQQVTPQRERCGNKLDDDCDGSVDETDACNCWGRGDEPELIVKDRVELDKLVRAPRKAPDLIAFGLTKIDGAKLSLKAPDGLPALAELLAAGDELFIIHIQGEAARVGTYEFAQVLRLDKDLVILEKALSNTYGKTDNSSLADQKVLAVRVPHYKRVLVQAGGELTVSPWDGQGGGILVFRAQEFVRIENTGKISVSGRGFRGGPALAGNTIPASAGESTSVWQQAAAGQRGAGSGAASGETSACGAGGGHASAGEDGLDRDAKAGAKGGQTYGDADLSKSLIMGSGGGAGGADTGTFGADANNKSGAGGAGGGILVFFTSTLNIAGEISANGANGGHAESFGGAVGGGGGGAGGALFAKVLQLVVLGDASFSAAGGTGGNSSAKGPRNPTSPDGKALGGKGGDGRIDVRFFRVNGETTASLPNEGNNFSPKPNTATTEQACR